MKYLWLLAALVLAGCAGWGPTKKVDVEVTQTINFDAQLLKAMEEWIADGKNFPTFNQTIELNGIDFKTDTEQRKADTVTPRTTIPLTYGDGQSTAGGTDLTNQPAKPISDSFNPVDNSSKPVVVPGTMDNSGNVTPDGDVITPHSTVEDVYLKQTPDGSRWFNWLQDPGEKYGKDIVVKFNDSSCPDLLVPDGSVSTGSDGTASNLQQAYWFSGRDFKPGDAEYSQGRGSVFSAPGCKATKAVIQFN